MENKINLLVVDDEQIILDSIRKLLKKEDVYSIYTVNSVDSALEYMKNNRADIILTDLMMPDKDGLEFLNILNKMNYDGIVIMLTGYATINSALQAMELGAFDYLAKPFTRTEITRILNRARDLIAANKNIEKEDAANHRPEQSIIDNQSVTGKNTWFMTTDDGLVMIGVERPFVIEIGSIESVYMPEVGDEIRQGSSFFQIFSSDFRTFSVTSPFSGVVKEINKAVIKEPAKYLDDPYNTGWLIKLLPSKFEVELSSLSLKY
jgi:CheY-like chemotaxis protein/glycine cleavage system H lipoate-binding protein